MIRLGLIGCGEHSEIGHAIPLARYGAAHPGEIELAAACDLRIGLAQDFCGRYGFASAYSDVDEMLAAEKIDGCIAVVPVDKISLVGIKLLGLQVPCVVEKPLGVSLTEAKELLDTARETGTPNMVSVNRRFMPYLNRAIEWARSAGDLRYVRCTIARHARREPEFLWTTAVHAVDALRHIAGEVTEAKMQTLQSTCESAQWYVINLRFEHDVIGRVDVLPTAGMLEETYELIGEGFRVSVTCPFGPERGWRCFQGSRLVSKEAAPSHMAEDILNGSYDEVAEFIRALTMKDAPRPSIEDVFPSVEICLALAKTAEKTPGFQSRRKSN
ncbi:MAG TPA: Gfo/Idh/MocA family oxidoreductase [Terriglobales bacterium]|nr:Gfo/Idh/MocA family oxidoreductase [Terriglobales bacterium]